MSKEEGGEGTLDTNITNSSIRKKGESRRRLEDQFDSVACGDIHYDDNHDVMDNVKMNNVIMDIVNDDISNSQSNRRQVGDELFPRKIYKMVIMIHYHQILQYYYHYDLIHHPYTKF